MTTVAGEAIYNDKILGDLVYPGYSFSLSSKEKANAEIPKGCVLVIAQNDLCQVKWNTSNGNPNYAGSNLQAQMNALCTDSGGTLGFTANQKKLIIKQKLIQAYYTGGGCTTSTIYNQYLFRLATTMFDTLNKTTYSAYYSQNFLLENYLTTSTIKSFAPGISYAAWYPRSGYYNGPNHAMIVREKDVAGGFYQTNDYGLRPSFVLKLV